jgi:hypothetical protein
MLVVLVQIDGWDPIANAPVTLYCSSIDDSACCHLSTQTWLPVLAKLPVLSYDFFGGDFDSNQITAPSAELSMQIEPWPNFARYALADARIQLWTGALGGSGASYTLRFDGRITAQPNIKDGVAQISFAADDRWLDGALLPTYAGTTGAEGPADLKGQCKPLCVGAPRYVPGKLIDSANNVFQVSAYGCHNITDALERLARFGAITADYATYADLVAAAIPPGRWATSRLQGFARFGAPTNGQISFLVEGDNSGPNGWVQYPGEIIRRIALLSGGAGKTDDTSLYALTTSRTYKLSVYFENQTTAREQIQAIAASVNAVAGVTWLGKLFAAPIGIGAPTITLKVDGSALPPVASIEQITTNAPWQKLAIGAQRAWVVHQLSDVAFTSTLVDMGAYAAGTTYRDGNIVQDQGSSWLYINPTPSSGNAPPTLPIDEDAYWKVLAKAGEDGEDGTASWTPVLSGGWTRSGSNFLKSGSADWTGSVRSLESYANAAASGVVADPTKSTMVAGLIEPASGHIWAMYTFAEGNGHVLLQYSSTTTIGIGQTDTGIAAAAGQVLSVRWVGTELHGFIDGVDYGQMPGSSGLTPSTPLQLYVASGNATSEVDNVTFSSAGAAAPLLTLQADAQAFTFDGDGNASPSGQTITLNAIKQNISGVVTWAAEGYAADGTDLGPVGFGGAGDTRTISLVAFGSAAKVVVQISLGSLSDKQTFVRLTNGSNAITPYLTNEAATVAADSSGNVSSFTGAGGTMVLYKGAVAVTSGITFSVAAHDAALAISINSSGVYSITGLTADQATATLRATYNGINYDKIYTIAKSRAGAGSTVGFLTNESATVAAANDGTVSGSDLSAAGGTFKVFSGLADVTTSSSFSVLSHDAALAISINGTTGVFTISGLTADTAVATLRAAYGGVNVDKVYSIAKSRAGGTGATGASAKVLTVISDRQTITYDGTGALSPSSQTTTFTAQKQNTTNTCTWTMTKLDGTALTASSYLSATTGDSVTMTAANFDAARGTTNGVIVIGTVTDGSTLTDKISVVKVAAGSAGTPGNDGTSQFTLVNRNGMTIAGRTVTKTGGTNATWDGSVVSAESFTGGATMSFVPGSATGGNNAFYIGLNTDPLTDNSFSSIDYGIKIDEFGNATWSDSSGSGSLGTWTANSTTFQITYTGTTIVYSRNGVATHTTTGVAAGQTLFLDSSFYYSTAVATNITFAKAGADGAPGAGSNAVPVTNVAQTVTATSTFYQTISPFYIASGAVAHLEYDGSIFYQSGGGASDFNTWVEVSTNGGGSWTQISSTHTSGSISSGNISDTINLPVTYTGTGSTTTQFRIATQRASGAVTANMQGTFRAT